MKLRTVPPPIAYMIGLIAGLYFLVTFRFVEIWLADVSGNDFSAIWAGPHVLAAGGDPYNAATWQQTVLDLGVQPSGTAVFTYPGWVPIALLPFGELPLGTAAVIWLGGGMLVAAVGLYVLLRETLGRRLPIAYSLFAYALVASEPSVVAFYSGQWTFLLLGLICLSIVWLRRKQPVRAGLAASVMIVKPQLFALAIPALARAAIARGLGRAVVAAGGVLVAAAAVSTALLPHWWAAFLSVPGYQAGNPKATTLPVALEHLWGDTGVLVGVLTMFVLLAIAFRFPPTGDAYLAGWLSVSLSAAVYEWAYDQTLVLVPLALTTGIVATYDRRRAFILAAAGTLTLIILSTLLHAIVGTALGSLSFNVLAQLLVVMLVLGVAWPYRAHVAVPRPAGEVTDRDRVARRAEPATSTERQVRRAPQE